MLSLGAVRKQLLLCCVTLLFIRSAEPSQVSEFLSRIFGTSEAVHKNVAARSLLSLPSRSVQADAGRRPKIYVYNVTERFRENKEAWTWIHTSLYGLELTFPLYLLDSPYVTTNPEEADYFYVWAWLYTSNFKDINALLEEIKKEPWWDRKQGKDHIFALEHDQGLCDSSHGPDRAAFHRYISNSIIMEHWGKVTGVYANNPCHLLDQWASTCDQVFEMVEAAANNRQRVACYTKGKDLLVPTITSEKPETTRYLTSAFDNVNQTTLIIFGGGINQTHLTDPNRPESDAGYSFGVRQTFARLYHNHPEVKIFYKMEDDYWTHFHGSTFCLAPAGWGWGARVKSAITRGCIPVIIQDGIKAEWEDELPMKEFAIRLPFMYIHRLPEILHRFVRLGRVKHMQKNLACVWRLYWWTRPHGRAFEMTMCTLKARLHGKVPQIDFNACTLDCGDGKPVDFNKEINSI